MTTQELILPALSLGTLTVMAAYPMYREWWRAIRHYPFEAFLLFALFIGIFFLGGERSKGDELLDTTRIARVVLYITIAGLALMSFLLRKKRAAPINTAVILMLVYGIAAMATAIYSVFPALTLWKGFEVVTHVLVAAVLATRIARTEDANRIFGLIWFILTLDIASLLWGALLFPDEAFRPFLDNTGHVASDDTFGNGLRGVFPKMHLNSVTQIGSILSVVAVSYLAALPPRDKRLPAMILLIGSLIVMLFGHSRTSIFAFTLALLVIALYVNKRSLRLAVTGSAVTLGVLTVVSGVIATYVLRGQTSEQFASLTGRLPFWSAILDNIMDSPLIGKGYYATTRVLYGLPGVDNTYLNVLLGGGILLLAIFIAPIIMIAWHIYKSRPTHVPAGRSDAYRMLWMQTAGLFIILLARSASGPSFDANHFNLILFLVCSIGAATLARGRKIVQTPVTKSAAAAGNRLSKGGLRKKSLTLLSKT